MTVPPSLVSLKGRSNGTIKMFNNRGLIKYLMERNVQKGASHKVLKPYQHIASNRISR